MKRHTGFTLIQMVVAMLIFAVLAGIGTGAYQSQLRTANLLDVSNDLRLLGQNMEDAALGRGFLLWESPSQSQQEDDIVGFLAELEEKYFLWNWDYESLTLQTWSDDYYGFQVATKTAPDPWGCPYHFYYVLQEGGLAYILFVSGGTDSVVEVDSYPEGDFGDDVILLLQRRRT